MKVGVRNYKVGVKVEVRNNKSSCCKVVKVVGWRKSDLDLIPDL